MVLTIIVILAAVAADIATKYIAAANLADSGAVTVIPHVVEFTYVENKGAAFGMLTEHRWVFLVLSTAAIAAIIVYLFVKRPADRLMRISLALIAGGGIGNMIERVAHGYVTDFINPTFVDFYVFNVADSCVTVGCAMLILWMIVDTVREKKRTIASESTADGANNTSEASDGGENTGTDADSANNVESEPGDKTCDGTNGDSDD